MDRSAILHWLLAVCLHWSFAKPSRYPQETQQLSKQAMSWMDVYWRSVCQTRESLVAINSEYPEQLEFIFVPSCVLLSRCSGCCNDEQLQCVPTATDTVLMQILKVKHQTSTLVEMSFLQHRRCECRPKNDLKEVTVRSRCSPCSHRKRHGFQQNPTTCECVCLTPNQRCQEKGRELNLHTCRCERPRR